jgi:hypothetical protein
VATDWDGYRDLVCDGETGFLVPTCMVDGATATATARLILGEINYDYYLAQCNQAAVVDVSAAAAAYARLLGDAALRQQLGAAARQRALRQFTWKQVVHAYEEIWLSQEQERRASQAVADGRGPSCYPPPEVAFAGYPTRWLTDADSVTATPDAAARLTTLLTLALSAYSADTRCTDPSLLTNVLRTATAGCTLSQLDEHLQRAGIAPPIGRATVAWLLKYDLLRAQPTAATEVR